MAYSLWLRRDHFDFYDPWEHVHFQVVATYDVVGTPGWNVSANPQPFAEMWLIREGTVRLDQEDRSAIATAGTVALLLPGQNRRTFETEGKNLSIIGLSFQATLLGGIDFLKLLQPPLTFEFDTTDFSAFLHRLVHESREKHHGYSLAVEGLGQLALLEILRAHQRSLETDSRSSHLEDRLRAARSPELAAAINFVTQNSESEIDVPLLAKVAHLSPKHFGRKFHAALGMPPMEYVRRVRLNRARELLASTQDPAGTIAGQCGFEDAAHFSRAFKRQYGLSPVQYRTQVRTLNRSSEPKKQPFESSPPQD